MDVNKTRKSLATYNFDSSNYIQSQLCSIPHDAVNSEQLLLEMFDNMTKNLTNISDSIEDEVSILHDTASMTENVLLDHLELNSEKLGTIGSKVNQVQVIYENASDGAIRIGSKLAASEQERSRVLHACELLEYVRFYQEECSDLPFHELTTMNLREYLPYRLQHENWGVISKVSVLMVMLVVG